MRRCWQSARNGLILDGKACIYEK
jgi:hypothetical protein